MSYYVIGVDMGATNIVCVLSSKDGEIITRDTSKTRVVKEKKNNFSNN